MPSPRKVAQITRKQPGLERPSGLHRAIDAKRLNDSATKGTLVGFALRTALDAEQGKRLTKMERVVFEFLERRNLTGKLLRRTKEMPKLAREKLIGDYATVKDADLDKTLISRFQEIANTARVGLEAAEQTRSEYRLDHALGSVMLSRQTIATILGAKLIGDDEPSPPHTYDFSLNYRGITTHDTSDRWGGVEPYLVASFYRVAGDTGGLQPLRAPFVIKQSPWGLGDMASNEWMPSGGSQDSQGNPNSPKQIFTGTFPPLGLDSLYFGIVKVIEEDGGQGDEIAASMGDALLGVGGTIIAAGIATGQPLVVLVGALVAAIGLICELVSLCFASGDDLVGDIVMAFDSTQIMSNTTYERAELVGPEGGNKWTLYFGVASTQR